MAIMAALFALLTPARSPLSGRVERSNPAGFAACADDADLLAVATAMGVVRDLTEAAAAPALAGAR